MINFFPGDRIPSQPAEVSHFLQQFEMLNGLDRQALAAQIRELTPVQISEFFNYVLSRSTDEALFSMTLLVPDVVGKMSDRCLDRTFDLLFNKLDTGRLSPAFFNQCVTSLTCHCNPMVEMRLLGRLGTIAQVINPSIDFFKHEFSQDFDQAVATDLEKNLGGFLTHDDFSTYLLSLTTLNLPVTLETLLKNRQAANDNDRVTQTVARLFSHHKFSDAYIDVCRRTLGDEQFLDICWNQMVTQANRFLITEGIRSVAKLSRVFGEEQLHSPEFFEHIFAQHGEGHVPRYIEHFFRIGFEIDLPVLKATIINNLERLIYFKPSQTDQMEMTIKICALASKTGVGAKALGLLLQRMGEVIGGEAFDDPPAVLIESMSKAPAPPVTERSRGNALLLHVVEAVGLKTLKEVVPDVGTSFLSEYLATKKPAMTEVEVMRLFPQMKGKLLEDQLGL